MDYDEVCLGLAHSPIPNAFDQAISRNALIHIIKYIIISIIFMDLIKNIYIIPAIFKW